MHGEADRLPSLIVDRYGDYLVVQTLSQGMDRLTPLVVAELQSSCIRAGILARNDPRTRLLEGLEQKVEVLAGERARDDRASRELGVEYEVDLRRGQKTGLFLDQRENRAAAALLRARSACSTASATTADSRWRMARAVRGDRSPSTSRRTRSRTIRANAARNGVTVDARVGNVFDELRGLERLGERFDTIVLDPPAFAKSKSAVEKATAGYKEINLRALKLLSPGGTLVTCSCSYNVNEAAFAEIVYERRSTPGPTSPSSRSGCRPAIIRCCSASRRPII